jgi:hypothetical protein
VLADGVNEIGEGGLPILERFANPVFNQFALKIDRFSGRRRQFDASRIFEHPADFLKVFPGALARCSGGLQFVERLKEGAIEAFGRLFARQPLYRFIPEAMEVNYLPGVSAFYNVLGAPKTDGIHEPISRRLQLHLDSDASINHIGVTFAMTMRWRLTGPLVTYDYDAVKAKYNL